MRPQKIDAVIAEKRERFHAWLHKKDYISIPIIDKLDAEDRKRLKRQRENKYDEYNDC